MSSFLCRLLAAKRLDGVSTMNDKTFTKWGEHDTEWVDYSFYSFEKGNICTLLSALSTLFSFLFSSFFLCNMLSVTQILFIYLFIYLFIFLFGYVNVSLFYSFSKILQSSRKSNQEEMYNFRKFEIENDNLNLFNKYSRNTSFSKNVFHVFPPFCHSFRFVGGNALFSTEDYRCPGHGATDPVLPKAMTFTTALSGTVIVLM